MQQLDNMDIAGNQISVTIAPLSQAEAAAAAAAAAAGLDLDDAEGVFARCNLMSHQCSELQLCPISLEQTDQRQADLSTVLPAHGRFI